MLPVSSREACLTFIDANVDGWADPLMIIIQICCFSYYKAMIS